MARHGLVIDMKRCTGCYACFMACRDEAIAVRMALTDVSEKVR